MIKSIPNSVPRSDNKAGDATTTDIITTTTVERNDHENKEMY